MATFNVRSYNFRSNPSLANKKSSQSSRKRDDDDEDLMIPNRKAPGSPDEDTKEMWCAQNGDELWEPVEPGTAHLGYKRKGEKITPPKWQRTEEEFKDPRLAMRRGELKSTTWDNKLHLAGEMGNLNTMGADWDWAEKQEAEDEPVSRRMAKILRHDPHQPGMQMDAGGWVPVLQLANVVKVGGRTLSQKHMFQAARWNGKKDGKNRFELSKEANFIRCPQGHNPRLGWINELQLFKRKMPVDPTCTLLLVHATFIKDLNSILETGLQKTEKRAYVHFATSWNSPN
jgi:RNA:NAD 2'-phosphotransferase (TPT1/KptA family)